MARKAAGLSQATLLSRLQGTAQSSLSAWETGKRKPSVDDIRELAVACGCSTDFLLGLTDSIGGNMAGQWIIDLDLVRMARQKKLPPDKGRFARPIPTHFEILSSIELAKLEDELFNNRKK